MPVPLSSTAAAAFATGPIDSSRAPPGGIGMPAGVAVALPFPNATKATLALLLKTSTVSPGVIWPDTLVVLAASVSVPDEVKG